MEKLIIIPEGFAVAIYKKDKEAQKLASSKYYEKNAERIKERVRNQQRDKYATDGEYRMKLLHKSNEYQRNKKSFTSSYNQIIKIL